MKPEDKAREEIDRQLGQCGWIVQDRREMNITARFGVAVRDFVPSARPSKSDSTNGWLAEQESAGTAFTPQQRQWLVAIKEHIANSLSIDQDDFDQVPFNQFGGLGRAYELFGDRLPAILEELNARLAA